MPEEKNYAQRLPGGYARTAESTNARLLSLPGAALEDAKEDLKAVEDAADIEKASGETLDLYGQMLRVARGVLDDTQYRFLIKSRVVRNFVGGDQESVARGVMGMFGAEPGEVELADDEALSGVVRVRRLPFEVLQRAGFTGKQAVQIVRELLPAGVRLEADNFEGSFSFAEQESDYDEALGFADGEQESEQSMGGYFGFVLGDETAGVLPL